jgi:azurin
MPRFVSTLLLPLLLLAPLRAENADIYARPNLAAWCIVPFDAKKRTPAQRAEMVKRLGLTKIAYDWRQEHVAEFEQEILEYKKHGLEFFAFWSTHEEAFKLFEKYDLHPQIWVSLGGGAGATHEEQVKAAATAMLGVVERTRKAGCKLGLYNHGGWGGEPENQVAVCEYLRKYHQADHAGIVYNLHHGHGHLDRLEKVLPAMLPYLLCVNINGMDIAGDAKGRKILPLGAGTEDVRVLKIIRTSGYKGPIGILNHTDADAEGRLLDNLDGLDWLRPQLDGKPAGPKPKYRTWSDKPSSPPQGAAQGATGAPSMNAEFGKALSGRMVVEGRDAYRTLPITIECRAKLNGKDRFNILIACDPKSSSTHWELYTYAGTGVLSLFLPGRGGEFKSTVNICDGQWHDLLASIEDTSVRLWVDGKQVLEKVPSPIRGTPAPGPLAFGGLVEGNIGCDGVIDDVRISRGVAKPRGGSAPRQLSDMTLGLWNFDNLSDTPVADPPAPKGPAPAAFAPERKPLRVVECPHWEHFVNRDRVFDFYAKEARQFMAQKPLPELLPAFPGLDGGKLGHWGNQNDATTWRDGRWSKSDLGDVFSSVFTSAKLTVPKSVCVRLGDHGEMSACFDPESLTFPVVWKGGFLKLSDARHGFMSGGRLDGTVVEQPPVEKPPEPFVYRGFYRHGKRVIFAWKEPRSETFDSAWCSDGKFSRITAPRDQHALRELTNGGPAQWPQWIDMKGTLGSGEPFATDTIPVPFENPYGTLFFLSGHDFFRDGTAAVATMTGEVWLVRGLDAKLAKVRWKRFATGLHQPLGVKIVNDELYVLGRDQITRLHDLNGDDEADFYECVTNAQATSPGGHDYITGLDSDGPGRFYFASGNQGVCKTFFGSPTVEVLAKGFRNPNGIGLSADGTITTSVQEGDWTPASAICQITTPGLHYGAGGPKNGQPPEPPLLYMPRGEDNSSGGQCFVTGDAWSSLRGDGNLVHLSPGSGSAFLVMRQKVDDRWQGAAMRISGGFDSGAQAGRFHPIDGQFYATGMTGWGSYTPMDGCFQRVRFTGGKTPVPIAFEARDNGVLLRFNQPLDASFVAKAASHFAQCWNYRYSAAYGSPEFSVRYPETPGHDPLEIRSAQVLDAGRALFLEIPQLVPANQIHLHVGVTAERAHDLFLTAHALAPAFKDFPGYQPIAKAQPASARIATAVPQPAKPNPWVNGDHGRTIVIEAALGLQFAQKQFAVKAGERVSLTFTNPDMVPHNWVLAKPGTLKALGEAANKLITDPTGLTRHYVPDSPDVLVYTDMANPTASFTIHFTAPKVRGDYPYLCTFPGHWMVMNGVMKVE